MLTCQTALRRSADNIIDLVSMMGRESKMPCFSAGVAQVTASLRQRFQLQLSADEAEQFVETNLIAKSLGSYYTRLCVLLHDLRLCVDLRCDADSDTVMIPSSIGHRASTSALLDYLDYLERDEGEGFVCKSVFFFSFFLGREEGW